MKSCPLPILLSALFGLTLAAFAGAQDKVVTPMQGVPASRESQVTMANYRDYPMSMWAFRNAGAVLNTVTVPREGDIRPLPGPLRPELGRSHRHRSGWRAARFRRAVCGELRRRRAGDAGRPPAA